MYIILLFFVLFTGARCFCRHIFFKDFFGFVYRKLFTSPLIISSFLEYSVKIIYIFHILMMQSWFCVSTNPFLFIVFWKSYSCFLCLILIFVTLSFFSFSFCELALWSFSDIVILFMFPWRKTYGSRCGNVGFA